MAGKKGMVKAETQPSAHGIRIEPRVDDELKQKVKQIFCFPIKSPVHLFKSYFLQAAKAAQAKVRKAGKEDREARKRAMEDLDEFDMMTDEKNLNTSLRSELDD